MPGMDSLPEQQSHTRHLLEHEKTPLTDAVTWIVSSSQGVTLQLERGLSGGFCFRQLGENSPRCSDVNLLQLQLRGAQRRGSEKSRAPLMPCASW